MNTAEKAFQTPLEDLRAEALKHYDELATKCHHWSSFVVNAIKAYDPASQLQSTPTFQNRVDEWLMACFGEQIARDKVERNHRFLEEALELVQSLGCTKSEAHQLVDYVFNRPIGEPYQECGGVMVTLAALCLANGLDMMENGETELKRIWTKVEKIREKQANKPKHSPLPQSVSTPTEDIEDQAWKFLGYAGSSGNHYDDLGSIGKGEYDAFIAGYKAALSKENDLRPQERELREKVQSAKNDKQKATFLKALNNVQGWIKEFGEAYDLLNKTSDEAISGMQSKYVVTERKVRKIIEAFYRDVLLNKVIHKGNSIGEPIVKWMEENEIKDSLVMLEESAAVKDDWKERFSEWYFGFKDTQGGKPLAMQIVHWIETNLL